MECFQTALDRGTLSPSVSRVCVKSSIPGGATHPELSRRDTCQGHRRRQPLPAKIGPQCSRGKDHSLLLRPTVRRRAGGAARIQNRHRKQPESTAGRNPIGSSSLLKEWLQREVQPSLMALGNCPRMPLDSKICRGFEPCSYKTVYTLNGASIWGEHYDSLDQPYNLGPGLQLA